MKKKKDEKEKEEEAGEEKNNKKNKSKIKVYKKGGIKCNNKTKTKPCKQSRGIQRTPKCITSKTKHCLE